MLRTRSVDADPENGPIAEGMACSTGTTSNISSPSPAAAAPWPPAGRCGSARTTVARQIAALEEALELTLFEKRPAGYALTASGDELLGHAEAVEAAAHSLDNAAGASTRELSGTVQITTEEVLAMTVLAPMLRELHDLHPKIHIDLDSAQTIRDLGAGEADIALRSTSQPQPAGVVGRRGCRERWTLLAAAPADDAGGLRLAGAAQGDVGFAGAEVTNGLGAVEIDVDLGMQVVELAQIGSSTVIARTSSVVIRTVPLSSRVLAPAALSRLCAAASTASAWPSSSSPEAVSA